MAPRTPTQLTAAASKTATTTLRMLCIGAATLVAQFVAEPVHSAGVDVSIASTDTIALSECNDAICADAVVDPVAGNALVAGPDGLSVTLDGTGTDNQALTRTGDVVVLESGGSVDLSDLRSAPNLDNDASNELGVIDAAAGTYDPDGAGPAPAQALPVGGSSTYIRNGDGSVTLDDGVAATPPFVLPVDVTSATLATVLNSATGLSKGQWEKPETRAATAAEVDSALGTGVEVPVAAMQALWTNRAAEGGSEGMMNPDGSIGFYSKFIINNGSNGMIITSDYNGGFHLLSNGVSAAGYTLDPPDYDGQVITIWQSGQETLDYPLAVPGGIQGTLRDPADNKVKGTGLVVFNSAVMRGGESMTLEGAFGRWFIRHYSYNLRAGANYRENADGSYDTWMAAPYNPSAFPAFATAPTVVCDATNCHGKGGRI